MSLDFLPILEDCYELEFMWEFTAPSTDEHPGGSDYFTLWGLRLKLSGVLLDDD